MMSYSWWVEGIGSVVVASSGIIFNIVISVVILESELAAFFFNWLLLCLAFFDNFYLLNAILEAFRKYFIGSQLYQYFFVYFFHYFRGVIMCCSEYMVILLALERYHALAKENEQLQIRLPNENKLRKYFLNHWKRLMKYVCPFIIFTILHVPKFFESKIVEEEFCVIVRINESSSTCLCQNLESVRETDLRNNKFYILWYLNVTNIVVTVIIPIIALVYLFCKIFVKFREHKKRYSSVKLVPPEEENSMSVNREMIDKEHIMVEQTTMLFAIIAIFLISHTPRSILNIEEFVSLNNEENAKKEGCIWLQYWTVFVVPISHILLQIKCSTNLLILCVFSRPFRRDIRHKLRKVILISMRKIKCPKRRENVARNQAPFN